MGKKGVTDGRPLDGVRVLDLTRLLPGAYCTLLLADLGAEVIKVEEPQGGDLMRVLPPHVGGLSVYHHALNRNKQSITLDLRAAGGSEVLDRLLEASDVVIESFRPRTAHRLKVSAANLLPGHPRLVHCSLTGFGQTGPYAERAAHDLDFVALAGLFEIDQPDGFQRSAAPSDRPGSRSPALHVPRLLVADIGSAWAACSGVLAALFQRERNGRGSAVDISIHDVAASWLTFPAAAAMVRGRRGGPRLPITGDAACYNLYTTADGRYVALAAIEQKFWRTFCDRVGRPEFAPLQLLPEEQPTLRSEIEALFASRTLAEWLAMFADVDICLAPVNSIDEAIADEHFRSRGTIAFTGQSAFIRSPIVFNEMSSRERLPVVPARPLGADTDALLRSVGFDDADLGRLRSTGAI